MKKRLGQNFLTDKNIAKRIVDAAGINLSDLVVEIGPGRGILTEELAKKANQVLAIEIDRTLSKALQENLASKYENLKIIEGDILEFDFKGLRGVKVVGNIPYYITSPIIAHLLEHKHSIDAIFITIQKEVAARLVAKPNTKEYSPISCFVQYHTMPEALFKLSKNAFLPRPEVDSCVVKLEILKPQPSVCVKDEGLFFKIIRSAFNKRRKTILNSLSFAEGFSFDKPKWQGLLKVSGIEPSRRPETVSLKEFAKLTDALITFI